MPPRPTGERLLLFTQRTMSTGVDRDDGVERGEGGVEGSSMSMPMSKSVTTNS